jgi:hypothetical protein
MVVGAGRAGGARWREKKSRPELYGPAQVKTRFPGFQKAGVRISGKRDAGLASSKRHFLWIQRLVAKNGDGTRFALCQASGMPPRRAASAIAIDGSPLPFPSNRGRQ